MTQTDISTPTPGTSYASPVDVARYGPYRINQAAGDPRPLYRFTGRLVGTGPDRISPTDTTPPQFVAEPGRYHLYSGWFCPWAQRSTLVIAIAGLGEAVSVSYVDGARDARGWAFRETNGPDPVNGFTLLRQAYDATEAGFDGHVSVPTLWDRRTSTVASNDYATLDADLASQFRAWSTTGIELYPEHLRAEIDGLEAWLLPAVNQGVHRAAGEGEEADAAREGVRAAFEELEERLGDSRYLTGDHLTLADVRLYVTLVRYDAGANAAGKVGPRLPERPNLWAYARDLYQQKAFRQTTDPSTFTAPGAEVPDWDEPVGPFARTGGTA
jgi:glutathionyl-hydroquinone reductase